MKKSNKQITVPSPCSQDWFDMDAEGEQPARFCNQCQEHVYDISSMTRREALAFMEKHRWQVCVNYEVDEDGEILYAPEPPSRWARQLDGALRLAAAAALVVPLLSACEEAPEQIQPTASTPIVISADGAKINADETAQPGAGRSPSFSGKGKQESTEPDPVEATPDDDVDVELGPECDGLEDPGDLHELREQKIEPEEPEQLEKLEKEPHEEEAAPPTELAPRPHHRRLGGKPVMRIESDEKKIVPAF